MRWSIRFQFLVPLGLLLLGLVGISTWTAWDSARLARQRIAGQVQGIVHTLGDFRNPLNQQILEQLRGLTGAEYLLFDLSGQRLATISGPVRQLPPAESIANEPAIPTLGDRIVVEGRSYLCRGVKMKFPNPNAGATLYVLYPESLLDEAIWQAIRPSLVLGISGGLASLAITLVGGQRIVGRIQNLERRTRLIAGGDFSPMPLPHRNDELRDLACSVNEMAAKLAQYQEAITRSERARLLDQVSGGLAHQLRNAVTGAKLAVQLHAESCAGGDREALIVAERQLSRMATDLKRFFDLGRAAQRHEPCSLNDLIEQTVDLLRPQCQHAHTELIWKKPDQEAIASGDRGQLEHLLLNLLGNAVEAAGPGGTVEVRLIQQEAKWTVEIVDSGPGPPPQVVPRLFEPFVTGKPGGIGLGLSVAKQVAEAHGGTIAWERKNDRTCFRVELPFGGKGGPR
jgi:signal transduction histidine kinase